MAGQSQHFFPKNLVPGSSSPGACLLLLPQPQSLHFLPKSFPMSPKNLVLTCSTSVSVSASTLSELSNMTCAREQVNRMEMIKNVFIMRSSILLDSDFHGDLLKRAVDRFKIRWIFQVVVKENVINN